MALKAFMGRNEREPETREEPAGPRAVQPPAPRTVSPSTSVDAATELEGTLRCKETLRIDGRIKGEIECEKAVLVGECARVEASISGDEVTVAGGVKGDITARRKITLGKTAVVTGDLTTPGIVIEEGAKVKGRIVIGSDDEPAERAADTEKDAKPARASEKPKASDKRPVAATPPDATQTPRAAAPAP